MTSIVSRSARESVREFAELVECTTPSSAINNSCLQNIGVDNILKYSKPEWYVHSRAQRQLDFVWMPVIDGEFIPGEPLDLINDATFLDQHGAFQKDYLIGVLNDEGALLTTNFFYPIPLDTLSNSTFFTDLQTYLLQNRFGKEKPTKATLIDAINTFYTGKANLPLNPTAKSALDLCSDLVFGVPAVEAALALSNPQITKKSKTFLFQVDYCPPHAESQAPCFRHGDILALVFPRRNITDPVEAKLSDLVISVLSRFAKSSDPGATLDCGWPEFEPNRRQYLRLSPNSDVRSFLYHYRMQFWLRTVPCIMYGDAYCT
ncbi:carboxylic ester hydrolase [Elysia marginata]|uniref:Carboxylic ester hydrolase n=1 Tax=Elysia marginata TaxID=1093978 RepID=A0AAV4ILL1_9GAST|nr:carboxylic ester hydrolase [Elysia marginata]